MVVCSYALMTLIPSQKQQCMHLRGVISTDREYFLIAKGKRNPSNQWYCNILSKFHGTDIIASGAERLLKIITDSLYKARGGHSRFTRLVNAKCEPVCEIDVNINGHALTIKNDMSQGLWIAATTENIKWFLTTLHSVCSGETVDDTPVVDPPPTPTDTADSIAHEDHHQLDFVLSK